MFYILQCNNQRKQNEKCIHISSKLSWSDKNNHFCSCLEMFLSCLCYLLGQGSVLSVLESGDHFRGLAAVIL